MKILVLGAGRVGQSVAASLLSERNDITIIDTDPVRLRELQDRMDLRGVVGNGIQPSVLREAGIEDADMLISCAPLDETNLVACKVAHDAFRVPTTIARLRSPEFVDGSPLLATEGGFAVNQVICPEQSVTAYIRKLIEYPEALQVLEFADGLVSLIAVRAGAVAPLVGRRLAEIPAVAPAAAMRVVAIYRGDKVVEALDGDTCIEPGDEVFVLAATVDIRQVLHALAPRIEPVRRLMIGGGGKVGLRLARELRDRQRIKLVERDRQRCEYLATELPAPVLVLNGDITDEELLEGEGVRDMDLFLALTDDDEDNIMACLLAKRLGARRVFSLINRQAYADLVQGGQIDIAISPAQTVIGELLAYVRRGDVEAVHSLRHGAAEALEGVVRGDRKTCRMAGRRIDEIALPAGAQVGAIVRGLQDAEGRRQPARAEVLIAHHDTVVQTGDHVIVFVPTKRLLREVERLFQVSATFFF
ncbi:Trk system potassium transporter TrkA [Rubrivivax gelatinosus]|uniref:Trk system potassium uptake protein TrkA n=1 Tax=Rubrivivax gelatinosus (strain NBRC 100245 / IL144) TaxID=983917 RepID=I0HXE7_RUBGI|nr:Trk system potassium transporter TrkA [Rubrivivax gelatinosus]BAL97684.1 Trk system potassium uptake protein TrkA [Rubrivivax gelatinosus IL144]